MRASYLMGDNLKVLRAEFSTLSKAVLVRTAWQAGMSDPNERCWFNGMRSVINGTSIY